jgi:hypothetical protein
MPRSLLVALVGLAIAVATPAAKGSRFVYGDNIQLGWVSTDVAPERTCVGGEPTGSPWPPYCTEETNRIIGKHEVQTWMPVLEGVPDELKPMLEGPITFEVNCTLNRAYRGPCSGTFVWEVAEGTWEGSWVSPVMDLITYESTMRLVGHGRGGSIDGMQLKFDGGSAPYDWYITGTVRVH